MNSIAQEIQQLQLKLDELEKQKKEKEEHDKKISISHNFGVISDLLNTKKTAIFRNRNSNKAPLVSYKDQELVTNLEAIYNILQVFNERLNKIENNNN